MPFIVSDCGEVAPIAIELQEYLVDCYKRRCTKEGKRADGCKVLDLVRNFRDRFKLSIQVAIAAGLGGMINAAGQHWDPSA